MPLTVDACVAEVVDRIADKLAVVGLPVTPDHTNVSLVRAVRKGLPWVGVVASDPTTVSDADLATVVGWDAEKLYDAATLEALLNVLGRFTMVDEKVGNHQQMLSQVASQTRQLIDYYTDRLTKPYGPNFSQGAVGGMLPARMPNDTFRPLRSLEDPCAWPYPPHPGCPPGD